MKRKYYPHATLAAATTLTVAPLLLFFVCFGFGDEPNDLISETRAPAIATSGTLASVAPTGLQGQTAAPTPKPVYAVPEFPMPAAAKQNTQIHTSQESTLAPVQQQKDRSNVILVHEPHQSDALEPIDLEESAGPELEIVPLPVLVAPPIAQAPVEEPKEPEMPHRANVGDSYYAATGHLAMYSQPVVPDPLAGNNASGKLAPAPSTGEDKKSNDARKAGRKNPKSRGREAEEPITQEGVVQQDATARPAAPRSPFPSRADDEAAIPVVIEDVVIQTPVETKAVAKIEDVIAVTKARGWPVALIKSDLPDDVWWVQQMVGLQNNAFAARVNFGNDYSILGSEYHMVIVFLDSADEVRRFRIAKQFKDIPVGVRRSREFHYIRN